VVVRCLDDRRGIFGQPDRRWYVRFGHESRLQEGLIGEDRVCLVYRLIPIPVNSSSSLFHYKDNLI
jgi:hypothetical protein